MAAGAASLAEADQPPPGQDCSAQVPLEQGVLLSSPGQVPLGLLNGVEIALHKTGIQNPPLVPSTFSIKANGCPVEHRDAAEPTSHYCLALVSYPLLINLDSATLASLIVLEHSKHVLPQGLCTCCCRSPEHS